MRDRNEPPGERSHAAHEDELRKAARTSLGAPEGPWQTNPLHLLLYRAAAKPQPSQSDKRPTLSSRAAWYLADFYLF